MEAPTKKEAELSHTEYKYYPRLEVSIVQEMLEYDQKLKENYILYQELLNAMTNRNFDALETILQRRSTELISDYTKTSLKTLRKHLPYIENSFFYPYNNGRIKGINNKIKVLNRVAYGYRDFTNFKNRIMLNFKLRPVELKAKQNIKTHILMLHKMHKDVRYIFFNMLVCWNGCRLTPAGIARVRKSQFQPLKGWN